MKQNQIDSIEQLVAILNTATPGDPIARVSVSPWAWLLLTVGNIEHQFIATGPYPAELEAPDCHFGIAISIDESQTAAYRLWDQQGEELTGDSKGYGGRPEAWSNRNTDTN